MTREEAIARIREHMIIHKSKEPRAIYITEALEMAIKALEQTEPERKTGKWEYIQYDGNPKIGNWHCSNCRLIVNLGFEGAPYYHYCPSCGTRMEVDNG
jgi:rubrerythrin